LLWEGIFLQNEVKGFKSWLLIHIEEAIGINTLSFESLAHRV